MNDFWTDSHSHLYVEAFHQDRHEAMARCQEAGVAHIYLPNIDHRSIEAMLELEMAYPSQAFACMGLHPCSVKKDFEKELYLVESWLGKRSFAAIGEMGLDLYWDKSFVEEQKEAFRIQATWAKQYRLPLIIHSREATDEAIALIEALQDEHLRGVFHCFTGTLQQAEQIIALGFMLGIGGVATYKKGGLDQVLPFVEMQHLVLETDSPYLPPVPHRGKRNESAYLPLVGQAVAHMKGLSIEEVRQQSSANAQRLFAPAKAHQA
jgi:TatD DNase family protein